MLKSLLSNKLYLIIIVSITMNGVFLFLLLKDDPKQTIIEGNKPEVKQADSSIIIERNPDIKPVLPIIPKGSKAVRSVSVKIASRVVGGGNTLLHECPPATLNLTQVKEPDSTSRFIASSPDGVILGAVDIPITPTIIPKITRWSTGISLDHTGKNPGIFIDRRFKRLVLGADFQKSFNTNVLRFRMGVNF